MRFDHNLNLSLVFNSFTKSMHFLFIFLVVITGIKIKINNSFHGNRFGDRLNNRLNDERIGFENLGLVIIDEAHYNSFRKLFGYFSNQIILGVTATPLSSNIKLPLKDNYNELIVGESISSLVEQQFLSKATTYSYDVNLRSLKIGINGDYTVSSSERLYGNYLMQEKLLYAYEEKAKGTKTLIFNNGINTSKQVQAMFEEEGYELSLIHI